MAALIQTKIEKQFPEFLRDKVVTILGEELDNQFMLGGDYVLDVDVWMERTTIFDVGSELKPAAVNVQIVRGNYENQDVRSIDGLYEIAIDCYCKGAASDSETGDAQSMVKLQRLVSVIRAILMDARYKNLGFSNKIISNRRVSSVQYFEYNRQKEGNDNTDFVTSARVILEVRGNESVELIQAEIEKGSDTAVTIGCTDKGYVWSRDGCYTSDIPYTPCKTCDFSVALYNTDEKPLYVVNQDSNNPFVLANVIVIDGQGNETSVPYDPTIPITTPLCPVLCEPATAVLKNTAGTELSVTEINSGDSDDIIAPDGTIRLNSTSFGSVLSGATRTITVRYENGTNVGVKTGDDLVIPNPVTCSPATVNVNGNLFNTVASGGTLDVLVEYVSGGSVGTIAGSKVLIPDPASCAAATAVLKDTDGDTISTTPIASGASANIVAPNGSVTVNNSLGTTVSSGSVKSNGSLTLSAPDGTAVLKDTAGSILSSTAIVSDVSSDITAPDGDITVNSVAFDSVLSGGTTDVEVRQETGATQVGSKQGQYWRIADSDLTVNSAAFTSIGAEDNYNLIVKDTNGRAVGSKVGSEWIVPALVQDTFINVLFDTGATLDYTITIDANTEGTYTAAAFSGGMSSATYEVNGGADTLPFTLVATDTLRIVPDAEGTIKLTGTY